MAGNSSDAQQPTGEWITSIQYVAIRLAGTIESTVDVTRAGTPDAEAHVRAGSVLVRVGGRRTAQRLSAVWREAALHVSRLPARARHGFAGNPHTQCPAGLVVRIGRDAALAHQLMPQTPYHPGHLRIQTGPVAWLITDRAAFISMRQLWERVEDVL